MNSSITKLFADSLRAFAHEKYGIKLGAAHAHELGAAFFGYPSKNAMLADTKHPLSNLHQASIIVMVPDAFIDERRKELQGLSPELPDSYTLGEAVYTPLFSDEWWANSPFPPFRSFEALAKIMADDGLRRKGMERTFHSPVRESIKMAPSNEGMYLTVLRFYQLPTFDGSVHEADITTTINLPRVAGHIGYGVAHISVEINERGMLP